MESTIDPNVIYDVLDRHGFPVLRIDNFDRGNYAEIRAELKYADYITVNQLQEITLKLQMIEKNEKIELRIVHIDLIHKTIRLNIHIIKDDKEHTEPSIKVAWTKPATLKDKIDQKVEKSDPKKK